MYFNSAGTFLLIMWCLWFYYAGFVQWNSSLNIDFVSYYESSTAPVTQGVPQGADLSPLFLIVRMKVTDVEKWCNLFWIK